MASEKSVTIRIIGDAKSAQTAFNSVEVSAGKAETSLSRIGTTAAGFAIGGALTQLPGLLLDGAKGAAEDEAAMARLKTAVENTGKSYDSQAKSIDEAIKRGQELAFTDGETADALSTLTSLTGDSDEALRRLSLAQDLARGTGISLEQAAKLLGKTSDENTTALARLGIQVGENATAQDVLNAVDEKFKGQAGTYAESSAGQMLIAQQNAGELAETFGGMLIPVISLLTGAMVSLSGIIQSDVAPAIQSFVDYLASLQPIFEPLISFIQENLTAVLVGLAAMLLTVVVPAFVAWAVSAGAAAVATVVALAPVIATMAAVGLAVGALYLAWDTNFLGIQDITKQVLDFIGPYFDQTVKAIQTVVEVVFPIIATVVKTYITILRTEIEIALAAVQLIWNTVFPAIQAVAETVFPAIAAVVSSQVEVMRSTVETGLNAIRFLFDNVFVPIQGVVADVWSTIVQLTDTAINGYTGVYGTVESGLNAVKSKVSEILGEIKGIWDSVWGGFSGVVEGVVNTVVDIVSGLINAVNGVIGRINSGLAFTVTIPSNKVTDFLGIGGAGFTFDPPDIPTIPNPFGGGGGKQGGGGGAFKQGASAQGQTTDGTAPGVIGEPASGGVQPAGNFANPQGGGGSGKGMFGDRDGPNALEDAANKVADGNDDFLKDQRKENDRFLKMMDRYVERIVKSNEAVPGATAKAVRSALASAI
jgi:hypothetical protein